MDDWERQGSSKLLTQHSPSSTIPKVIMADAALAAAAAAAAALAAVPPRIPPLTMILENVLGFSAGQINAIRDEGYTDLEDFTDVPPEHLRKMCINLSKLSNARGGVRLGGMNAKKLCGLSWWLNDRMNRMVAIVPGDFDRNALTEAMTASGIDELIAEREVVVPVPPVFTYEGWEDWEKAIINYLSSKRGTRGTPLEYVIRNDVTFHMPDACRYDQLVHGAPLVGMAFDNDTLMVHKILLPLVTGTDAEQWMSKAKCGRSNMSSLREHYDGVAEGERRLARADDALKHLTYVNEASFSFETYTTNIKKNLDIYAKYAAPGKTERESVKILFDGINNTDPKLITSLTVARNSYGTNFQNCVQYLSTEVARHYPAVQPGARKGYGGRSGRRGGPKNRSVNSTSTGTLPKSHNGVDMSDITRWFPYKDIKDLGSMWDRIQQHPTRIKSRRAKNEGKRASYKKKKRDVASVATVEDPMLARIINGVMQAQISQAEVSSTGTQPPPAQVRMPQMGSHAGNSGSVTSGVTNVSSLRALRYDANGQIIS